MGLVLEYDSHGSRADLVVLKVPHVRNPASPVVTPGEHFLQDELSSQSGEFYSEDGSYQLGLLPVS